MTFTFVQARVDKTTNANHQCESQDMAMVKGLETPGFLAKAKRVPPSWSLSSAAAPSCHDSNLLKIIKRNGLINEVIRAASVFYQKRRLLLFEILTNLAFLITKIGHVLPEIFV